MRRDALGRRRTPDQERGLRPLHPRLPAGLSSRSIRLAMTERAWRLLASYAARSPAATAPRALGELVERALEQAHAADWQEWQIRKERSLLERRAS
jgi:hypothetical protein